ncbi:MAG: biopolymer transporter ExbD [Planctomycetia bacterium]|nr:biopolymer transporter ExbD [Planctomycetia bacterium]
MSHRKKKKKGSENVELNLAAMLDMAFQLLAFFILTFKPSPIEGQINLKLPPPLPVAGAPGGQKAGDNDNNKNAVQSFESLVISVFSTPGGKISTMAIGEANVAGVSALEGRLKAVLSDANSPFKQVIIQVASRLKYAELMRVVDVCTRQTLPTGEKLTKLSFVELPTE